MLLAAQPIVSPRARVPHGEPALVNKRGAAQEPLLLEDHRWNLLAAVIS
jgi:hypothetical protein